MPGCKNRTAPVEWLLVPGRSKQSPSRRDIETRTRDACATQMEMFRLAAETDRLAACAPNHFIRSNAAVQL